MSHPQDPRAEMRQQRWIEIFNSGGSTIPPFGIVEIVGYYRPDKGSPPFGVQGGPTVVDVKRPTEDSICEFLINGPAEVEVGKWGRVATNDYPAYVLYSKEDTPANGEIWGTQKDSYSIAKGRQGVAIMGSPGSDDYVLAKAADKLLRVKCLQTPLWPGDTVPCKILRWDGSDWVETGTTIDVSDTLGRVCMLPNEEFWSECYGDVSHDTVQEAGLRREGKIISVAGSNDLGFLEVTVEFWDNIGASTGNETCPGTGSGFNRVACYYTMGTTSLPPQVGNRVFVHYHPEYRRWKAIPLSPKLGFLRSNVCFYPGDKNKSFDLMGWNGSAWVDTGTDVLVQNTAIDVFMFPGELIWGVLLREETRSSQALYETIGNFGLTRTAVASSGIACYGAGNAIIWVNPNPPSGCNRTATNCTVSVCNNWGFPRNILGGEQIKIRFYEAVWQVFNEPKPTQILATTSDFCPDDVEIPLSSVEVMDGCLPSLPYVAYNVFSLASMGGLVYLKYRQSNNTWIIIQPKHQCVDIVAETCRSSQSQQTENDLFDEPDSGECFIKASVLQKVAVMSCVTPAKENILEMTPVPTVITMAKEDVGSGSGSCLLTMTRQVHCLFVVPDTPAVKQTVIDFTPQVVLQDVREKEGTLCLEGYIITIYSPCVDGGEWTDLICGIDCAAST